MPRPSVTIDKGHFFKPEQNKHHPALELEPGGAALCFAAMTIHQQDRCPLVLVVEDDDFLRFASSHELAESGFQTLVARSADEAVAIMNEHEALDALFTDISMPGIMNGVALAHHVCDRRPHALVVITSGDAPPAGQPLPRNARFVLKPYTMPDIAAMIRYHVEDHS